MSNMTISEVKARITELESEIGEMLDKFSADTTVSVKQIELKLVTDQIGRVVKHIVSVELML